jgi:hypothetical protein
VFARLALPGADDLQQGFDLGADFLFDRLGRFFSCGVNDSSTGRVWQIFSLTSRSWPLSSRNR